jgi:hypothetical protein
MKLNPLIIVIISWIGLSDLASANKFNGLNENCQPAPTSLEEWTVRQTFRFTNRGKSYRLVWSSTIDGGGSLCSIGGKSPQPVGYNRGWYLDRVARISDRVFVVKIHDGNGNNTPAIKYRLDLSQPENPQTKILKRWI